MIVRIRFAESRVRTRLSRRTPVAPTFGRSMRIALRSSYFSTVNGPQLSSATKVARIEAGSVALAFSANR